MESPPVKVCAKCLSWLVLIVAVVMIYTGHHP